MIDLLDGNVLVALGDANHVHHDVTERWFAGRKSAFATCPITQGTLLRMLLLGRVVENISEAVHILDGFLKHPRHRFWPNDLGYDAVRMHGVIGHRQITDAYLAALARKHEGKLVTLDRGLAALHRDVAERIPV
ncbi:MAG: PIN domain-containing protein [Xanthomonadaceae bacterium]|nr:PIN domain-containing protein [Xanthomonadaceae bacterium]MDE1885109.1 PIN domain-containing protein [Xanthomonadaceae bacterium]MDE1960820.1 PIN domain-containing protein [Xanthomonadaceae bacterium]MDE2085022.1 PIN domain-containing protein [Xanthomonadaceae bacterium]